MDRAILAGALMLLACGVRAVRADTVPCGDSPASEPAGERPSDKRPSVRFGKLIGRSPAGEETRTIEEESRVIFRQLHRILAADGLMLNDVDELQVILADITELPRFNAVLFEYFPERRPSCVAWQWAGGGLPFGARVQINGRAVRR